MNQKRINVILSLVLLFALVAQIVPLNNVSFAEENKPIFSVVDLSGANFQIENPPSNVAGAQLKLYALVMEVRDSKNQTKPQALLQDAGDYVIYGIRVQNIGDKAIDKLVFADNLLNIKGDAATIVFDKTNLLKPGQTRDYRIDQGYKVTLADVKAQKVVNSFSIIGHVAKAKPEDMDEWTPAAYDSVELKGIVAKVSANVELIVDRVVNAKGQAYADGKFQELDDVIVTKVKVTNTGNKPIDSVWIEPKFLNNSDFRHIPESAIAPNASVIIDIEKGYKISKEDAVRGYAELGVAVRVTNNVFNLSADNADSARVYGQKYKEVPYSSTLDTELVVVDIIDKDGNVRGGERFVERGDEILFGVKVKNCGLQPVTSVRLVDQLVGLNSQVNRKIAPQETVLFKFNTAYKVKAEDFDAGYVVNKVDVTAYDEVQNISATKRAARKVTGTRIPLPDPTKEKVDINVGLRVLEVRNADQKVYMNGKYEDKGDLIIYGLTIENVGTRTIDKIWVRELMGLNISQDVEIKPGEVLDVKVDQAYKVTQEDMDRYFVVNKVEVIGRHTKKNTDGTTSPSYTDAVIAKVKADRNIGEKQELGEVGGYNPIGRPADNAKPGVNAPVSNCPAGTTTKANVGGGGAKLPETGRESSPVAAVAATLLLAGFILRKKSVKA